MKRWVKIIAYVIYVILDNAKYHFSGIVQEYVENSRIQLVFLPSYSPDIVVNLSLAIFFLLSKQDAGLDRFFLKEFQNHIF